MTPEIAPRRGLPLADHGGAGETQPAAGRGSTIEETSG